MQSTKWRRSNMKAETALIVAVVAGILVWYLTREREVRPVVLPDFVAPAGPPTVPPVVGPGIDWYPTDGPISIGIPNGLAGL